VLMVATAMDEGRDTGVSWLHEKSPLFDERYGFGHEHKTTSWLKIVATNPEDDALAKVATDFYDYNFGKDDV